MSKSVPFHLKGETLWLCADRCIYWEEERALILSDLHLGKTGHFRKSGIAVPQSVSKEDLQRLFAQIQFLNPKTIDCRDLFHSYANKEMELFLKWRNDIPNVDMHLIKGNHDILAKKFYENANIKTSTEQLSVKKFCFTHDIHLRCKEDLKDTSYTFSGHIHPGISIKGLAKQSLHFACFYFGETYSVLPAFSHFTGFSKIKTHANDKILR